VKLKRNLIDVLLIAAISPVEANTKPRYKLSGIILNNSFDILNTIQNNLFQDDFYENKRIGTVTMFAGPIRVATTVLKNNGERAIGTRVSQEVGRLFKDFVRIKNDKTRDIPGSGLGLSIVKKLVDLYHGDIKVKSNPEKGTYFNLTFPKKGDIS